MSVPQPGIFAEGTDTHAHLELDVAPDAAPAAVAAAVVAARAASVRGDVNVVVGFGADLWRRVAPGDAPADLAPFRAVEGEGRRAPATQHDLWIWLHGTGESARFDAAAGVVRTLAGVATLAAEAHGFRYRDGRDLTGFLDGTENPPVDEAPTVATVPAGAPGAGGAHVLVQRWVHDLAAFGALPPGEQELVIGRTRADSTELEVLPPTAHIARVVIEEDGEELEIYRRSVPYGRVGEHGLLFVAFSADPSRFTRMLARMFGTAGDGRHDRLTDFSRPVSGACYFAPSLDALHAAGG